MSRLKDMAVWLLVPLLAACAGKILENRLYSMSPDAQLELLAEQSAQYPDDLQIKRLVSEPAPQAVGGVSAARDGGVPRGRLCAGARLGAPCTGRRARRRRPARNDRVDREAGAYRHGGAVRREHQVGAASAGARHVTDALARQPGNARAARLREELLAPRPQDLKPKLNKDLDQPITVQFRDQPLISIFELVANITGLNFTFDREVQAAAPTTIFASNTPVRQVLTMVLQANQLASKVVSGNSILVYPKRPDKETEYRDLVVRTFYLQNAQAAQALGVLKQMVKTRDAVLDECTNAIIMRDAPDTIKVAERIIRALDVTPAEVVIDAQVLEVSSSDLLRLGVQCPDSVQFGLKSGTVDGSTLPPNTVTLEQLHNLNSSDVLVRIGPVGVNFLQAAGVTKTLANPSIRVRNREKAKVLIGDRLPWSRPRSPAISAPRASTIRTSA